MNIKRHIPNILTLGNLFCGCLAVNVLLTPYNISIDFEDKSSEIFWLISFCLTFDFLDGLVARALKVSSPIGKELDSLADMVSFGVLPGFLMFKILSRYNYEWYTPINISHIGLLIILMSGYRLAKFNVDTEQSDKFKGLPTPLNAIFIWSLFYLDENIMNLSLPVLIAITLTSSLLLVSNLPLLALKFKSFGWKENQAKFILILCSIALLIAFEFVAIPLILPLYLIISFLHFKLKWL